MRFGQLPSLKHFTPSFPKRQLSNFKIKYLVKVIPNAEYK